MTPDDAPARPACGAALEPRGLHLFCDACRGAMVTRDELHQMLRDIHPKEKRSLEQQLVSLTDEGARTCPHCNARMDAFSLNRVPLREHDDAAELLVRCRRQSVGPRHELTKLIDGVRLLAVRHRLDGSPLTAEQLAQPMDDRVDMVRELRDSR